MKRLDPGWAPLCLVVFLAQNTLLADERLRIATYNLENYFAAAVGDRPAKSLEAKAKICENIRVLEPDVLAIQEIGSTNALLELIAALKKGGLEFRDWEFVSGADTNIHLAVLSRFPIVARRPHTQDGFVINGRRFRVSRGFAEVEIVAGANYRFTLLAAHLKSKRLIAEADQDRVREEESRLLRKKIEERLLANPQANLVVLGDLNDSPDSDCVRLIIGRDKRTGLIDTRPAERNGNRPADGRSRRWRNLAWTYYYAKEDSYNRIDYILISRGMSKEWLHEQTYVLNRPDWQLASDHRPIVASFVAEDR